MAPKKKKSKAPTNTRGFATTSTPSKARIAEEAAAAAAAAAAEEAAAKEGQGGAGTSADAAGDKASSSGLSSSTANSSGNDDKRGTAVRGAGSGPGGGGGEDSSGLTPEQLEARLEEDGLQLVVDRFGTQVGKEAGRHAARLRTERRLLRTQADAVNIRPWLSEEVMERIEGMLADEEKRENDGLVAGEGGPGSSKSTGVVSKDGDESIGIPDETLAELWTVRRTLIDLDFPLTDVNAALTAVAASTSAARDRNASAAKKLAGQAANHTLENALAWLAGHSEEKALPSYSSSHLRSYGGEASTPEYSESDGDRIAADREIPNHAGGPLSSFSDSLDDTNAGDNDLNGKVRQHEDEDESNDDEDGDAQERYLRLMSRLYRHRPDLTEMARRPKKGKKGPKKAEEMEADNKTPRVKKILASIKSIESDILFDVDEARAKWAEKRIDLVRQEAERKKHGLTQTPAKTKRSVKAPDNQPGPPERLNGNLADQDSTGFGEGEGTVNGQRLIASNEPTEDGDDFMGLGDFMASLPEETTGSDGATSLSVSSETGGKILVRDFGKWSGVSPRRVLEEACRARDSAVKVRFSQVSHHGLSKRAAVEIDWSQAQDLSPKCPVAEVSCMSTSRRAKLVMTGVSTPDPAQSEAYVAVAALISLFAHSPKEEKVYMRMPPVWRDLHAEFRDILKVQADAEDRDELRLIRSLAEASMHTGSKLEENLRKADNCLEDAKDKQSENSPAVPSKTEDPDILKELWRTKSSTRAFKSMEKTRSALPMWSYRQELQAAIESNQVVIICGETGCGKSTQTPSFILESELSQGKNCKIYCTEPRRISAISLARRVSEELGEHRNDVGTSRSLVGYSIRLESKVTSQTRLIYATTGVVMRMLERDTNLDEVTHLVLDEVHERTIDSDFLLIILRKLMVRRPELKVVLMSATVNAEKFSKYLNGAPILNVPGRTFPVEVKYLEDAIEVTGFGKHLDDSKPSPATVEDDGNASDEIEPEDRVNTDSALEGYSVGTRNALKQYNEYRINYDLILKLLETIAKAPAYRDYSKAILVFLPGITEIRRLNDMLVGHSIFAKSWQVYPLHSTIATEEQERAFLVPPEGVRKIVLATNIAETGITIPDITCVVDTGTHKEMRYDERRQLSRLIEAFISRANAKQRRGRAGRVQNGLCFHLFTRARHDRLMAEQQTPEMMRLSLQDLVLRVKICKLGKIEEALSEALDPPSARNVRRAIDSLVGVKALTSSEDLTPLGRQLAKLPLDVFLGKLVLLGSIFSCLDSCLSIAAILSSKSPFSAPMAAKAQADQIRLGFKKGDSDLLTAYNAYSAWRRVCKSPNGREYDFCRKNYLSAQTLANIEELKAQLASSLIEAGFLKADDQLKESLSRVRSYSRQRHFVELPAAYTTNDSRDVVVSSIISWSFYPKLLAREGGGWRNAATNQAVSVHPASVNRRSGAGRLMSYYHIMQSSAGGRGAYNAHETSVAEDFAVALACGEADFRLYAGVVVLDANRLRLALPSWKSALALLHLRSNVRAIMAHAFRAPGRELSATQKAWLDILQLVFAHRASV